MDAVVCDVMAVDSSEAGSGVGRFVSFRCSERVDGLPVVPGIIVDATASVDFTSGA